MVHVAPRELRNVDQPVDAIEIDESTEVDDVRDNAFDDIAGRQLVKDCLSGLLALLLKNSAARENNVVSAAVELDHPAGESAAHELVEILHSADIHQGCRQETANAEIENQPALDDLDHVALYGLAALVCTLDALPGHLEPCALLRED